MSKQVADWLSTVERDLNMIVWPVAKSSACNSYELMQDVIRHITRDSASYNQETWAGCTRKSECGYMACVAGWIIQLRYGDYVYRVTDYPGDMAHEILFGNTIDEARWRKPIVRMLPYDFHPETRVLFSGIAVGDRSGETPDEYVKRGVAHIRKFMRKYSKQLRARKLGEVPHGTVRPGAVWLGKVRQGELHNDET